MSTREHWATVDNLSVSFEADLPDGEGEDECTYPALVVDDLPNGERLVVIGTHEEILAFAFRIIEAANKAKADEWQARVQARAQAAGWAITTTSIDTQPEGTSD